MGAMSEAALYRKYRPQNFKEVLGQEHIVKVLEGSLQQKNIAHAYLFAGSRGTGKTSVARILARDIGCSQNDIYEIDAASNRGIDDIRELREGVAMLPLESPYKVYIIDEAHMLTKEAWNALLKTLEEPPPYAVFVLATTELEKVPDTIVSRCQTFIFRKPSHELLKELVLKIARTEGFTLEPSSADLIALLGEGSFRDTQGILQKVIFSSKDKKISAAEVEEVAGAPKGALVNAIVEGIAKSDLPSALFAIEEAVTQNAEMKTLMKLLLHKVRAVLLLRFAPEMEKGFAEQFGGEDFKFLKGLSGKEGVNISSSALYELLGAYDAIGRSYIPQLPLELALVKICKGKGGE